MPAEARRLTDLAEASEQRYIAALSELTTSKTAADDERSKLLKESERLNVGKAILETKATRLDREVLELKVQRCDGEAEGSSMVKEELAKLEAQWQQKYKRDSKIQS